MWQKTPEAGPLCSLVNALPLSRHERVFNIALYRVDLDSELQQSSLSGLPNYKLPSFFRTAVQNRSLVVYYGK